MIIYNIDPNNYDGVPKWAKIVAVVCGVLLLLTFLIAEFFVVYSLVL